MLSESQAFLASKTNVTAAYTNAIRTKRPHSTMLTLALSKNRKKRYIGTFVDERGDDSPKQLHSGIAQFQHHFLHLMRSQILHSELTNSTTVLNIRCAQKFWFLLLAYKRRGCMISRETPSIVGLGYCF